MFENNTRDDIFATENMCYCTLKHTVHTHEKIVAGNEIIRDRYWLFFKLEISSWHFRLLSYVILCVWWHNALFLQILRRSFVIATPTRPRKRASKSICSRGGGRYETNTPWHATAVGGIWVLKECLRFFGLKYVRTGGSKILWYFFLETPGLHAVSSGNPVEI